MRCLRPGATGGSASRLRGPSHRAPRPGRARGPFGMRSRRLPSPISAGPRASTPASSPGRDPEPSPPAPLPLRGRGESARDRGGLRPPATRRNADVLAQICGGASSVDPGPARPLPPTRLAARQTSAMGGPLGTRRVPRGTTPLPAAVGLVGGDRARDLHPARCSAHRARGAGAGGGAVVRAGAAARGWRARAPASPGAHRAITSAIVSPPRAPRGTSLPRRK